LTVGHVIFQTIAGRPSSPGAFHCKKLSFYPKIIPLKKTNKENYTIAKAWRPISLLATLGKILEPSASDAWNSSRTLYLTVGHVIFQTIAGRPSSPGDIDDEGIRPQREPVEMPAITLEEVERQLLAAKSWNLPATPGIVQGPCT
jgi:hypothetical protein